MSTPPVSCPAPDVPDDTDTQQQVLASSAVMAAGTVVSRLSGFVRSALLAAALGASLHADLFTIANTVPNMLYILLAGGVFNAVLVPQLVRAMADDADGGEPTPTASITLAGLFLGAVTVALVVFAPQVMSLYLDGRFDDPDRTEHLESVVAFARYCLPQVFFYGMFVLVGQILNARGRFGPMMWAPIANNVISVVVLVIYLVAFGPARGAEQERPVHRRPGAAARRRLDPGHRRPAADPAALPASAPASRSAPASTSAAPASATRSASGCGPCSSSWSTRSPTPSWCGSPRAAPPTAATAPATPIYSSTFLIVMVPHSIITVSLATAILPRLSRRAADGDLTRLGATLSSSLRTALAVVVPFAALLPVRRPGPRATSSGATAPRPTAFERYAPSLALFGPGLVCSPSTT